MDQLAGTQRYTGIPNSPAGVEQHLAERRERLSAFGAACKEKDRRGPSREPSSHYRLRKSIALHRGSHRNRCRRIPVRAAWRSIAAHPDGEPRSRHQSAQRSRPPRRASWRSRPCPSSYSGPPSNPRWPCGRHRAVHRSERSDISGIDHPATGNPHRARHGRRCPGWLPNTCGALGRRRASSGRGPFANRRGV